MSFPFDWLSQRLPRLKWPIYFLWRLSERWGRDSCPLMAAAMAFFGFLSIFPLMLAVAIILGHTRAGNEDLLQEFTQFISGFFPSTAARQLMTELDGVAQHVNPTKVGVIGVLALLWTGRAFFDTMGSVLNCTWPGARPRSFVQRQLVLWSMFVGVGLLWFLSTTATVGISIARSLNDGLPDLFINRQPVLWTAVGRGTAWLLTTLMFWVLYWFLPNRQAPVRRRIVLGAAMLAATGWEFAKVEFTTVLANAARYQRTYGSVSGVVITLMWMYLSSLILLLGAEGAAAYEETAIESGAAGSRELARERREA